MSLLAGKQTVGMMNEAEYEETLALAENLLNQQFDSPTQANQIWVSDITYLWTDEGWLYLAGVLLRNAEKGTGLSGAVTPRLKFTCNLPLGKTAYKTLPPTTTFYLNYHLKLHFSAIKCDGMKQHPFFKMV